MQFQPKHAKALLGVGVLALVAVGVAFLIGGGEAGGGGQQRAYVLPVTLGEVARRDVAPRVQLTGTVRSVRRVRLGFTVAGVVSSLTVDEADRVRQGQVLATLDDGDQVLDVASRQAELTEARLALAELRAGTRVEEQARLEGELEIARAEEALAKLEVDRGETLVKQSVISAADLDALKARLEAARGKRRAAAAEREQARAGTREETLAVAAARVERVKANLGIAERELAKTRLRAPWDGVVARRQVSPGAVLTAGAPVFEVVDGDHLEIELQVPSRYALRLGERPQATVSCEEAPGFSVQTEVDAQLPTADDLSRNFTALIRLQVDQQGSDGRSVTAVFRPGMFVRVDLQLAPIRGGLVIPHDAIRQTERGPVVVGARALPKSEENPQGGLAAAWIPVRLLGGDSEGLAVEALGEEPLAVGDQVVLTGVDLAFPGVPLNPRPDPTAAPQQAGKK